MVAANVSTCCDRSGWMMMMKANSHATPSPPDEADCDRVALMSHENVIEKRFRLAKRICHRKLDNVVAATNVSLRSFCLHNAKHCATRHKTMRTTRSYFACTYRTTMQQDSRKFSFRNTWHHSRAFCLSLSSRFHTAFSLWLLFYLFLIMSRKLRRREMGCARAALSD
jgi:hypothetical protein